MLLRRVRFLRALRVLGGWFLADCQWYQWLRATPCLRRLILGYNCGRMGRWSGPIEISVIPLLELVTVFLTETAPAGENLPDLATVASWKTVVAELISLAGWSTSLWEPKRWWGKLHGSTFEEQETVEAATVNTACGPLRLSVKT